MYVYNEADLLIPLPPPMATRSDAGYTPATEGYSLAKGDVPPYNPDDYPGVSLVSGEAIMSLFGV